MSIPNGYYFDGRSGAACSRVEMSFSRGLRSAGVLQLLCECITVLRTAFQQEEGVGPSCLRVLRTDVAVLWQVVTLRLVLGVLSCASGRNER